VLGAATTQVISKTAPQKTLVFQGSTMKFQAISRVQNSFYPVF
jgi:hypothetical protein